MAYTDTIKSHPTSCLVDINSFRIGSYVFLDSHFAALKLEERNNGTY